MGISVRDEYGKPPECPVGGLVPGLRPLRQRQEAEDLAVDVRISGEFLPDMAGHRLDVVLQQGHVLENGMVDPLQDIVFRAVRLHLERVVDQAVSQRIHCPDGTLDGKLSRQGLQFFLGTHRLSRSDG